jgi:RNA polymerase sigma-70 factor, ECF subfamily
MRMPTRPNAAPLAGLALRCQPDSRLVGLSREGQTRAFEEIVRRYRGPLVSFAGAIVPADRAEDVVQEALARAHAALVASQAEVKLKPWLYAIVRNRALNDLRDEPTHAHLDESFDGVPQPPEVAARRSQLAALIARVKDLPPAQRDALVQRELEGRSHREIGVALGVTPGAVRGLIFRARTALRDGAGMLIPMPALRALLNAGPSSAEATGTGIGGAAVGVTQGVGGGIAVKAGTTLAIAVLAIGSGAALCNRGDNEASSPGLAVHPNAGREDRAAASSLGATKRSPAHEQTPGGAGPGGAGSGSGDDSGHGFGGAGSPSDAAVDQGGGGGETEGVDSDDAGHSGSGGDGGEHEDAGGTGGGADEGSSGTGGGADEGSGGAGTEGDSGSSSDSDGTSGDGGTSGGSGGETTAAYFEDALPGDGN